MFTLGEIEQGVVRQEALNPAFAADLRAWKDGIVARYGRRVLPFAQEDAAVWGALVARIGNRSTDLMIAAVALRRDLTVVTRNAAHFAPTGVRLVNPFDP